MASARIAFAISASRTGACKVFEGWAESSMTKRRKRDPRARGNDGAKVLNTLAEAPSLCHNFRFHFSRERAGAVSKSATIARFQRRFVIREHIGNGCSGIRKTPARGG
jgi:hypothetical protein